MAPFMLVHSGEATTTLDAMLPNVTDEAHLKLTSCVWLLEQAGFEMQSVRLLIGPLLCGAKQYS